MNREESSSDKIATLKGVVTHLDKTKQQILDHVALSYDRFVGKSETGPPIGIAFAFTSDTGETSTGYMIIGPLEDKAQLYVQSMASAMRFDLASQND